MSEAQLDKINSQKANLESDLEKLQASITDSEACKL